jgi:hypothetical protein
MLFPNLKKIRTTENGQSIWQRTLAFICHDPADCLRYCFPNLTLFSSVVTASTARCDIQKFYVLSTQCIFVFCVYLGTNSDYFSIQHQLTGFYQRFKALKPSGYYMYQQVGRFHPFYKPRRPLRRVEV